MRLTPGALAQSVLSRFDKPSIEAPAQAVANAVQTRLELWAASAFEKQDAGDNHARPIGKPDHQHRPIVTRIKPKPEENEVAEIKIAAVGRVVRGVEINPEQPATHAGAEAVVDDAVGAHDDPISGAAHAERVFDIA